MKISEVLELATEMGLEPDRITYSTLVKGFCLAGEIDQGLAVMKSFAGARHPFRADNTEGRRPNRDTPFWYRGITFVSHT